MSPVSGSRSAMAERSLRQSSRAPSATVCRIVSMSSETAMERASEARSEARRSAGTRSVRSGIMTQDSACSRGQPLAPREGREIFFIRLAGTGGPLDTPVAGVIPTPDMAFEPTSIKALTFDVFGTVVDWRSGILRGGEAGGEGHQLAGGGGEC